MLFAPFFVLLPFVCFSSLVLPFMICPGLFVLICSQRMKQHSRSVNMLLYFFCIRFLILNNKFIIYLFFVAFWGKFFVICYIFYKYLSFMRFYLSFLVLLRSAGFIRSRSVCPAALCVFLWVLICGHFQRMKQHSRSGSVLICSPFLLKFCRI